MENFPERFLCGGLGEKCEIDGFLVFCYVFDSLRFVKPPAATHTLLEHKSTWRHAKATSKVFCSVLGRGVLERYLSGRVNVLVSLFF